MSWRPRTLAEEWDAAMPGAARTSHVHCPACGRRTTPDMLARLPGGAEHVCDGCRQVGLNRGTFTREAFATLHGAPPAVLERARARDRR